MHCFFLINIKKLFLLDYSCRGYIDLRLYGCLKDKFNLDLYIN
jgi:hypothetical protein